MKLFIKVRYLGTNYCGYQVQPNAPSIQQKLNEAAHTLFGYDCDIVGCSRTDSGVHANEFCATVAQKGCDDLITSLPPERVPLAFSAHLPPDISAEWKSRPVRLSMRPFISYSRHFWTSAVTICLPVDAPA